VIYRVFHETTYQYVEPVTLCYNAGHLMPRVMPRQRLLQNRLTVFPRPASGRELRDYFGNNIAYFTIRESHTRLTVRAESEVEVEAPMEPLPGSTPPWENVRDLLRRQHDRDTIDAYQYAFDSVYVPLSREFAQYALPSFPPRRAIDECVCDLSRRIHREFLFDNRATTIATPLHEVFALRRGVCQDFAHLMIACLRSLGLAARYVSGYIRTTPPPGQQRLAGADASHAWVGVYIPSFGWLEIDPTNNKLVSDEHIVVSWGRDFSDVTPLKGVILGGGQQTVSVAVDVLPL